MDPVSHAALGRTLIALAGEGRSSRGALAAVVGGALSPDVDAVMMPFGWDRYLRVHEIGTHTVLGTLACAVLTATVVHTFTRDARWRVLALAAWVGAASHVLLDILSSARIRVFWPVFEAQISIPLVAMADPWLAAILAAAFPALWIWRRRRRQIAVIVLTAAAAFLTLKAVFAVQAVERYRARTATQPIVSYMVEARWASLDEWHVFDRTARLVRAWRTSVRGEPRIILEWPLDEQTSRAAASRAAFPAVRNFLRVHDYAFPVTLQQPGDREWVLWSDLRYCWTVLPGHSRQLEPTVSGPQGRIACALWVGGEFGGGGEPLRQLVKIVGFTQARGPVE